MSEEGARLLYIDDDVALGRLVQKDLGRHGFAVECASNGDEGLRRLAEGGFDVVALDHFLAETEGLEVLSRIFELPDPPPVIYVTGDLDGRLAVTALKAGAADYVIKDVAESFTSLLRAAIDDTLERTRLHHAKEAAEAEVRAARDRAEVLLREVNHRVSNSLQLVSSFISFQSRALQDEGAREALRQTQARIEAIAQVHRRLYTSQNVENVELKDYFEALIDELSESLAVTTALPQVERHIDPLRVPTDRAVALGVILTELFTNAVKYAYPPGEAGPIRIRLRDDGATCVMSVEDEGVGMSDAVAKGTGIGRMIISAMAQTLRSQVEYVPTLPGLRASLAFEV